MKVELVDLAIMLAVILVLQVLAMFLIWLERRLLGFWQDRLGPNRVGPAGLLQPVADMVKIFFKEDWTPDFVDKKVFVIAPGIVVLTTLLGFAIVPFAPGVIIAGHEHRLTVFPGHVFTGCLQHHPGRLGFQQQVGIAWSYARRLPDDHPMKCLWDCLFLGW